MTTNVKDLVDRYVKLRDKKAQIEAEHKTQLAPINGMLDKIEGVLLQKFQEVGVDSMKTEAGTAYIATKTSVSVADWDAYFEFIKQNDAWHMLNRSANKTAVEDFRSANDELPPGINYSAVHTLNVRRS